MLLALVLCAPVAARAEADAAANPWDDVVCRVNGVEILRRDVEQDKQQKLPGASFHGAVDAERQQQMRREALQALIDAELAHQEARRRDLKVSGSELDEAFAEVIARYPSRAAFEARMERAGIERDQVEEELRRQRLIAELYEQVEQSAPAVSAEALRDYYTEQAERLRTPEQALVRRIFIRMAPLEREPEDWQAALARLAAARARVEAGEPFAAVAREVSEAPAEEREQGGLLGSVHPGQLEPKLDAALWSLPEGGLSEPIVTFKGAVLLQVESRSPARPLAFDEVEERLRAHLEEQRRREHREQWLAGLRAAAEIEIVDASLAPPPAEPEN